VVRDVAGVARPLVRDVAGVARPVVRDVAGVAYPLVRDVMDVAHPLVRGVVDVAHPVLRDAMDVAGPMVGDVADIVEFPVDRATTALPPVPVLTPPDMAAVPRDVLPAASPPPPAAVPAPTGRPGAAAGPPRHNPARGPTGVSTPAAQPPAVAPAPHVAVPVCADGPTGIPHSRPGHRGTVTGGSTPNPDPVPASSGLPGLMSAGLTAGPDSAAGGWATTSGTWHPTLDRTGTRTPDSERRHGGRPTSAPPPG
jgi:hypothetical protein